MWAWVLGCVAGYLFGVGFLRVLRVGLLDLVYGCFRVLWLDCVLLSGYCVLVCFVVC